MLRITIFDHLQPHLIDLSQTDAHAKLPPAISSELSYIIHEEGDVFFVDRTRLRDEDAGEDIKIS